MAFFNYKSRGKRVFSKQYGDNVVWMIEWPAPVGARLDWKHEIRTLAGRAGASVVFDRAAVDVTACDGAALSIALPCSSDWKNVFLRFVDALHAGRVPLPDGVTLGDLFPPVDDVPAPAGLEDGFTPVNVLNRRDAGDDAPMLRALRSVSYSEALRLGVDAVGNKPYGITYGQKTELKLIECACGRLFVAHPKIIDGHKAQRWESCGCADGYNGDYKHMMRAAWREYCTMACLERDPMAALHKALAERDVCMTSVLPRFEDFWAWYLVEARRAKQQFVQRIDETKPFTMDNLCIPKGERKLLRDPSNKHNFKISI